MAFSSWFHDRSSECWTNWPLDGALFTFWSDLHSLKAASTPMFSPWIKKEYRARHDISWQGTRTCLQVWWFFLLMVFGEGSIVHLIQCKEACPWCKNHLGHWKHLAWECPENPLINQRPPVPTKSISWRFGWDPNEEILTYLGKIQLKLWEHVHAGDSAAAAAGESTGGA